MTDCPDCKGTGIREYAAAKAERTAQAQAYIDRVSGFTRAEAVAFLQQLVCQAELCESEIAGLDKVIALLQAWS